MKNPKKNIQVFICVLLLSAGYLQAQNDNSDLMQLTNGPEGIWTRPIALHPEIGIFICSDNGSYYQSIDQGETWQFRSKQNYNPEAMVVTDWGDIFMGSSKIYRSTDQALTWVETNSGIPSTTILSLLFNPNTNEILVGTYNDGVFVSSDTGATWQARNTGLTNYAGMRITSFFQNTNGDIYATATNYSDGYIFRSTDNANSWQDISDPNSSDKSYKDLTVVESGKIFAVTWNGSVLRSEDNGSTWENQINGINASTFTTIATVQGNILLLGTTYDYVYRSEDDGNLWIPMNMNGIYGSECWDIAVDVANDRVYLSMRNAGIFRSEDATGTAWTAKNSGLYHTDVRDIIINKNHTTFAAVWSAGVYRSIDDGDTWQWVSEQFEVQSALSLAYKPGYVFAGTVGDGIYYSTDDGLSWTKSGYPGTTWITAMVVGPLGYLYAGGSGGDIYHSTDNGATWTFDYDAGDEILDMVFNPHTNSIFVAVDDPSTGGVHRYDGINWQRITTDFGSTRARSLAVSPLTNTVYTGTADNGIYISTNNGDNWLHPSNTGLSNWISAIAVNSVGEIFAAGNGIYRSRDNSENYTVVSEQPNGVTTGAFAMDSSEVLYAGTYAMSVWRTIYPTTTKFVKFSVKMLYEDAFEADTSQVVVRGEFNNWGGDGDWVLTAEGDPDMTYSGTFPVVNTNEVIAGGRLEYKYVYNTDKEELLERSRSAEWDGKSDLELDPVWFSDQYEFTKMVTPVIVLDGTDSRGVAWGDYDNDGDEDLIVAESGGTSRNDLFENNGDKTFTKNTTDVVATDQGDSRAATWGDFNNDGYLDLYITNVGNQNNFLYKYDNANQKFIQMTGGPETSQGGISVGAAWADFNNDGYLDLFVANASGETNFLYLNEQNETFTAVTNGLVVTESGDSRGCAVADFNNDNLMDIFVANGNAAPNRLYQNNGDGSFTPLSGSDIATDVNTSLGGSWGDYNNDGLLDLYVTNQQGEPNILYRNEGSGIFSKVSKAIILPDSSESRGSAWIDYDKDGLLDLFVANVSPYRNVLYRQLKDGTFEKISSGPVVADPYSSSVGAAWADYDNDGDSDLFVANDGGANALYRNNTINGNWLKVRLFGNTSNATGIGAKVLLYYLDDDGTNTVQRRDIESQSGLLGQNSLVPLFGLGASNSIDSVVVLWPSGSRSVTESPMANTTIIITEGGTTEPVPPPAPVLNSPADQSTNVTVPPVLAWNSVSGVTKYEIQAAESITFMTLAVQDSNLSGSVISYTATTLTYNTTYYWRVRAKNEAGWGPWSSVWRFTTASLTGQPNPPTLSGPTDGLNNAPIPTPLYWTSAVSGTYSVQVDDDNLFPDPVYDTSMVEQRQVIVPGLEPNTQYYWRVKIDVSGTESEWSDVWSFTTYSSTLEAQTTIPFPSRERRDEFSSTDYLIRGLPGNADVHMAQIFGESAGERWMAYWDNGASSNYYVAVNNTGIFRFVTGRAFWVIHNGDLTIDETIPQAPLNAFAQAEIAVHYGFNLITSPFSHAIDWDVIKEINGITSDVLLWAYNRSNKSFESATSLTPVVGFYYFNSSSTRTKLLVPYFNISVSAAAGIKKPAAKSSVLWQLTISLHAGDSFDNSTRLGIAEDALPEMDDHDYRKPRTFADIANIYFNREEWDHTFSMFASDIRPQIEDAEIWDFQVYVPHEITSKLSFNSLADVPEEYDVYLIDKTRYTYVDLRKEALYEFLPTPALSDFEIVIGNTDNVMDRINTVIPTEFDLGQNFPNPFNPSTNIPILLPEKSDITLKIYNLLGQEIIVLFEGTLNAGKHYFSWDGLNSARQQMPSGIYIYQMVTNKGARFTQKMVLIK